MSSHYIAIVAGLCVYVAMIIDNWYIDPTDKPTSPKIALFVTLLVWILCEFIILNPNHESIPLPKPLIGDFYKK
jgi:hypothetical protein